jgi:hypothetical protein
VEWDILEVTLSTGSVHTMLGGGGISWWPDWDPSGTHYLASTNRSGETQIEDMSPTSPTGFSRVVRAAGGAARWAPDGARLVFVLIDAQGPRLALSNASGGREISLTGSEYRPAAPFSWSPDGQWVGGVVNHAGKQQLVKIKPVPGSAPVPLPKAAPFIDNVYLFTEWSPAGDWILYPSKGGMSLISPDGAIDRKLTSHSFSVYTFAKNGEKVYGILRDTTGGGAEWQLYSVDVKTGAEKMLAPVDLPSSATALAGFSLHPDGKRFLTSIAKWPYDIWMLEGFDQHKSWLDRLLHR